MARKKLKIAIYDYYGAERLLRNNYIFQLLGSEYDIELNDKNPDLIFFSGRWRNKRKLFIGMKKCLKVFFTGENTKPDFQFCDYAFSYEDTNERNFQLPIFATHVYYKGVNPRTFIRVASPHVNFDADLAEYRKFPKSRFCIFLFSNPNPKTRIEFCKKLMAYKKVDCPGKVLNNMPHLPYNKIKKLLGFSKHYKFSIAFENTSAINYTTERVSRAFAVGSIPIYWGNPKIAEFFNPEAFINCHDYDNFDKVIQRVIEVDNDDVLYQKYRNAPPILEGSKAHAITEAAILERLNKIVSEVGVVSPACYWGRPSRALPYLYKDISAYILEKVKKLIYHLALLKRNIFQ